MEAQSWRERRTRIDALKPELRKLAQGETTSELVEGASRLARSQRRQGQPLHWPTKELTDDLLPVLERDFRTVAVLAQSGPSRVELASPTFSSSNGLVVLKITNDVRAARISASSSGACPRREMSILRLAREHRAPAPRLLGAFFDGDDASAQRNRGLNRGRRKGDAAYVLALEHAAGGDLWALLNGQPVTPQDVPVGFAPAVVARWAAELVDALEWLHHEARCVHRDIKPQNVLLTASGKVLLTDFACAAPLVSDAQGTSSIPQRPYCERLVGTPDYIAPEVLLKAEDAAAAYDDSDDEDDDADQDLPSGLDARLDLWALGITLAELVYGQSPFFAPSIAATYDNIINHRVKLPKLPGPEGAFISRLLVSTDQRPSLTALRRDPWLRNKPWGRFDGVARPFIPVATAQPVIAADTSSVSNASQPAFNFSALFCDSPSQSGPRPQDSSSSSSDDDDGGMSRIGEDELSNSYWHGMLDLPDEDAFDLRDAMVSSRTTAAAVQAGTAAVISRAIGGTPASAQRRVAFQVSAQLQPPQTPLPTARKTPSRGQLAQQTPARTFTPAHPTSTGAPPPSSARRGRVVLSPRDELGAMQKHALERGSARKPAPSAGSSRLDAPTTSSRANTTQHSAAATAEQSQQQQQQRGELARAPQGRSARAEAGEDEQDADEKFASLGARQRAILREIASVETRYDSLFNRAQR